MALGGVKEPRQLTAGLLLDRFERARCTRKDRTKQKSEAPTPQSARPLEDIVRSRYRRRLPVRVRYGTFRPFE